MIKTDVKVQLKPSRMIVARLGLGGSKLAQRFLVSEIRRHSDPYVPLRSGPLKNTAVEEVDRVRYITPYAVRQYFENKGRGLRGKEWDKRMWANKGPTIINSVAKFIRTKGE